MAALLVVGWMLERRPVTTTDEDDHASVDRPGLWWQVKELKEL